MPRHSQGTPTSRRPRRLAPPADPDDQQGVADWVELAVSVLQERCSQSYLQRQLSVADERDFEPMVKGVWQELKRRADLYGDPAYDFDGDSIIPRRTSINSHVYRACLIWSYAGNALNPSSSGMLFERVACEALRLYLGGKCEQLGWPKNRNLADGVDRIADAMFEMRGQLKPQTRLKDRKVDGIAWIPFGPTDSRHGKVSMLMQCGAGSNWRLKPAVSAYGWRDYISFACEPMIVFAVPVVVANDIWRLESGEKGMLLDRVRIVHALKAPLDPRLTADLHAWTEARLRDLS